MCTGPSWQTRSMRQVQWLWASLCSWVGAPCQFIFHHRCTAVQFRQFCRQKVSEAVKVPKTQGNLYERHSRPSPLTFVQPLKHQLSQFSSWPPFLGGHQWWKCGIIEDLQVNYQISSLGLVTKRHEKRNRIYLETQRFYILRGRQSALDVSLRGGLTVLKCLFPLPPH